MTNPQSGDPTPTVGADSDIAPLGRTGEKPAHERTAAEDGGNVNWDKIAAMPEFKELLRKKAAFVIPTTIFFVVYYFALPVLVGYWPELMTKKVIGNANLAYVFAFSQFFMAWIVAGVYVRVASKWDKSASEIITKGTGK